YCLGREIHFIRGRLKFGGSSSNAPFGCCVVVFRPSLKDVQWIVTETDFRKAESKEG
ncbi:adenine methyltransferase, partial [Acinetobacter baumannii]